MQTGCTKAQTGLKFGLTSPNPSPSFPTGFEVQIGLGLGDPLLARLRQRFPWVQVGFKQGAIGFKIQKTSSWEEICCRVHWNRSPKSKNNDELGGDLLLSSLESQAKIQRIEAPNPGHVELREAWGENWSPRNSPTST